MNPFWSMSTSSVRKVGIVDKCSEETTCIRIEAKITLRLPVVLTRLPGFSSSGFTFEK